MTITVIVIFGEGLENRRQLINWYLLPNIGEYIKMDSLEGRVEDVVHYINSEKDTHIIYVNCTKDIIV